MAPSFLFLKLFSAQLSASARMYAIYYLCQAKLKYPSVTALFYGMFLHAVSMFSFTTSCIISLPSSFLPFIVFSLPLPSLPTIRLCSSKQTC